MSTPASTRTGAPTQPAAVVSSLGLFSLLLIVVVLVLRGGGAVI
jgi:hypothetical protein